MWCCAHMNQTLVPAPSENEENRLLKETLTGLLRSLVMETHCTCSVFIRPLAGEAFLKADRRAQQQLLGYRYCLCINRKAQNVLCHSRINNMFWKSLASPFGQISTRIPASLPVTAHSK
uniref:Uncharacterized protein n=1 Tax=Mus musculus TaxID=10090 RepID=Q3UY87_MOUSE|nr:unnamed protein product [Mus musculus]